MKAGARSKNVLTPHIVTPNNFGYANNEIYYKELTVMGSYSPSPKDLRDSFELLFTNKVSGLELVH